MSYNLSFFNLSQTVSDSDIQSAVVDLQTQVSNDFAPQWGVDAVLDFGGTGWPIYILDSPGQNDPQGALGYHYLDQNYNPYAVVFAQYSETYGVPWTAVASHELLEILGDPLIDSTCFIDNGDGTGYIIAQEVCDPTEQQLYYEVGGTVVSDFALRGWFIPGYPGQVDFLGQVPGPLQLLSGDYISYDYVESSTGWQVASGDVVARMATQLQKKIDTQSPPRRPRSATQPHLQLPPQRRQAMAKNGKNGVSSPDVPAADAHAQARPSRRQPVSAS